MDLSNKASVIIVTYDHRKYMRECLASVLANDPLEVIVVDNGSTDGTPEFIEENFPEVRVIKSPRNLGYGGGNNLGVKHAKGEYVVILNPDTKVEKNWLEGLLKPLTRERRLITTPKILLYNGSAINTVGNIVHFTGFEFTRGYLEPPESYEKPEYLSGISGACFAMRREEYLELGGFDENFLAYVEDGEFSWRAHAMGFKILYVPTSVVYHDYTLSVPPVKIYHLEKGRYIILRKYLTTRQRLAILPSLLMSEVLAWGYAILNGRSGIKFKLMGTLDGLRTPIERVVRDGSVLRKLDYQIPEDQLTYTALDRLVKRAANWVYRWNYWVVVG